MVPQEMTTPTGESVRARDVYRKLIDRYREEFTTFVHDRLNMPEDASSEQISGGIRELFLSIEKDLDSVLFPGDLGTIDGAEQVAHAIFELFPHSRSFCIGCDKAYKLIRRYPPRDLITILPCRDLAGLLELHEPCDALALASWSESIEYRERIREALRKECKPEDFQYTELKPLVVDHRLFPALATMSEITAVSQLNGRIVIGTLPKGKGGEFPKLRYFLSTAKNMVEAEFFGEIWAGFAREEVDFAERLVASIEGHWGRRVLSAHNFFENKQHRIIVERVREMAERLRERAQDEHRAALEQVATKLEGVADSYHLSLTMSDARFIPCSAWTWASYSFKGGQGHPTPLSVLVERDWATRDFILEYMEAAGVGNEETLDKKIVELIGEGRESEDLGEILLGTTKEAEQMLLRQVPGLAQTPAGKMHRPVDHPILKPIKDHAWESRYVLNCAAVRLEGVIYILYRAFGDDEISRVGLAWTSDGCHIDGRLDEPIFVPEEDYEHLGCEDPRVTVIGDTLYMLYTAYDGETPQIAMASITKKAFLERDWKAWERLGLGFPGFPNKDAVLYPEKFDGKYAIYHRIAPNMWISYLDALTCPFPRAGHRIVIGPRPGMMWDSIRIGAGAQPIKTEFGWLNVYHGVDYLRYYRLGVVV
ncbi:MAG: glycosidase, partial [Candidatus Hydrogenedentes bacterium]|nr:glycosidase [Candidatus Hydrogenedentota bacterium]